jgi:kinesin family protein 1
MSEKYVRGEEIIGSWRLRGITIVEDHTNLIVMERRAADVQAVHMILATSHVAAQPPPADAAVWGSEKHLRNSLDLWQKRFGRRGQVWSSLFQLLGD